MKNIALTLFLFISTYLTADEKEENLKPKFKSEVQLLKNLEMKVENLDLK